MHKNNDHRIAHQLIDKYHDSDTSLCIVVKDSKEARLINNELSLYLKTENINYFPENEILPYDHFSAPDNICLLYTSPSPRDGLLSRMPSSA